MGALIARCWTFENQWLGNQKRNTMEYMFLITNFLIANLIDPDCDETHFISSYCASGCTCALGDPWAFPEIDRKRSCVMRRIAKLSHWPHRMRAAIRTVQSNKGDPHGKQLHFSVWCIFVVFLSSQVINSWSLWYSRSLAYSKLKTFFSRINWDQNLAIDTAGWHEWLDVTGELLNPIPTSTLTTRRTAVVGPASRTDQLRASGLHCWL